MRENTRSAARVSADQDAIGDESAGHSFLLSEKLVSERNGDSDDFDHTAYVDTLETIVERVDEPWHIGLFGTWGTGKSSIVNMLYDRLDAGGTDSGVVCLSVNAWEHTADSIRTDLLLDINHELDRTLCSQLGIEPNQRSGDGDDTYGILSSQDILNELHDVVPNEETNQLSAVETLKTLAGDRGFEFVVAVVLGIVLFGLLFFVSGRDATTALIGSGFLTLLTSMVIDGVSDSRVEVTRTMENPRSEWAGAYEALFDDIVMGAADRYAEHTDDGASIETVVITVDDLDRCHSDTVYDTLIALKSFMQFGDQTADLPACLYIIPCDEDALYKRVEAADDGRYLDNQLNQHNFLTKFFDTRIEIPELDGSDLLAFARRKNGVLKEPFDESIIETVIQPAALQTPRRIIRVLNRLTLLRLLADNRSFDAIDFEDRTHIQFLAFVTVLREEFSVFHRALETNELSITSLNREWTESGQTPSRERVSTKLAAVGVPPEQLDRLLAFLTAVKPIIDTIDDPRPFFRLSGSELSESDAFRRFLREERTEELRQHLSGDLSVPPTGDETADPRDTVYKSIIDTELADPANRTTAVTSLLSVFTSVPTDSAMALTQRDLAASLFETIGSGNSPELLSAFTFDQIAPFVVKLRDEEDQHEVIRWYLDTAVSADSIDMENFRSLLRAAEAIGPDLWDEDLTTEFAARLHAAAANEILSAAEHRSIVDRICAECEPLFTPALVQGVYEQ